MEESITNPFESIFNPETVAVVGAANTFGKWGFDLFRNVLATSSTRRVYPVNRNATEVQGVRAYPSLRDLPEAVDFVVIVIPFPGVLEVVRGCVDNGAKAALIISAGLGETGSEGAKIEQEIVRTARSGGMRLIGPNCMGNFNTTANFSTLRQGSARRFLASWSRAVCSAFSSAISSRRAASQSASFAISGIVLPRRVTIAYCW